MNVLLILLLIHQLKTITMSEVTDFIALVQVGRQTLATHLADMNALVVGPQWPAVPAYRKTIVLAFIAQIPEQDLLLQNRITELQNGDLTNLGNFGRPLNADGV